MTTSAALTQRLVLDDWLPDSVVLRDLKTTVESDGRGEIELDSGAISIPSDANYVVVAKSWREVRFGIGLGNSFRVVVAVGGVEGVENGIVKAVHCFCTLWYTSERELITTDFSKDSPV